jgi:hypothetical protein
MGTTTMAAPAAGATEPAPDVAESMLDALTAIGVEAVGDHIHRPGRPAKCATGPISRCARCAMPCRE